MQYNKYVRNSKNVWKFPMKIPRNFEVISEILNKHVVSYKLLKWIKALVWRVR